MIEIFLEINFEMEKKKEGIILFYLFIYLSLIEFGREVERDREERKYSVKRRKEFYRERVCGWEL